MKEENKNKTRQGDMSRDKMR